MPEERAKSGTMYAQSVIRAGEDVIQPGDAVSASTDGIGGKEGYQQLVDSGAIGPEKPEEVAETGTTIGTSATVEEVDAATAAEIPKTRSAS